MFLSQNISILPYPQINLVLSKLDRFLHNVQMEGVSCMILSYGNRRLYCIWQADSFICRGVQDLISLLFLCFAFIGRRVISGFAEGKALRIAVFRRGLINMSFIGWSTLLNSFILHQLAFYFSYWILYY